jgi:hypothetical protein
VVDPGEISSVAPNPLVVCDPAASHVTQAMLQCNIYIALHKKA